MKAFSEDKFSLFATAVAIVVLFGSSEGRTQQLSQITACVELSPADSPSLGGISRKRRHTETDCDPLETRRQAFLGAQANASAAIRNECRRIIGVAAVRDICRAHRLSAPSGTTSLGRPPVSAGPVPIDGQANLGRSPTGIPICAVMRNLPAETVTSTSPAGIENGFCIFDGNRVTTVTARARARCGVQCF
jgi:hypothetical protein